MLSERELFYKEYVRREHSTFRASYPAELSFYNAIKTGDMTGVREFMTPSIIRKEGLGTLSDNPLQNLKYHLVITIAMSARYCIEGGMDLSEAYGLSDVYIQKTDRCKTPAEIEDLHRTVCLDYANRMRLLRKRKAHTGHIAKCIDYIYDHLHTRITVALLADHTGLDCSYLSRLFKIEVGVTITDYIRTQKIETAKNMLAYSDYGAAQIASVLAFPSQSYFSEIFRNHTGTTPLRYRKTHARETGLGRRDAERTIR
ncbi:MAG: helix-turn-helix domain-containing protein [Clostridiaceae bacterium]|nr:AraC family transcriptional regulator [Oscillospiraceae bacterium]NLO62198.1 helix-turn-helix domain-containing protein [Clostridiaceae bacterium]